MSAYVVQDKTVNRVVSHLMSGRDADYERSILLGELDVNLQLPGGPQALGNAMAKLNCEAVDARYGAGRSGGFQEGDYHFLYETVTPVSALKALRCWLYQCAEGSIPSESLLYATMERISGALALSIVSKLPEWAAARSDG